MGKVSMSNCKRPRVAGHVPVAHDHQKELESRLCLTGLVLGLFALAVVGGSGLWNLDWHFDADAETGVLVIIGAVAAAGAISLGLSVFKRDSVASPRPERRSPSGHLHTTLVRHWERYP